MPGVRQRLGIDADAAASGASSSTGDYFRGMYASARLSAAEVSQGASPIVSDLGGSSDVRQLGSANPTKKRRLKDGSEKLDTRNVSRDVRRAFARHRSERSKLPVPIDIDIPLWSKKGVSELKAVSFLLPHLLLDSIPEGEEEDSCFWHQSKWLSDETWRHGRTDLILATKALQSHHVRCGVMAHHLLFVIVCSC